MDITDPPRPSVAPPDAEFIGEFTRSQRRLYLFILSQVGNPQDAEDILQETNVIIWRKADQYQPGTKFLAWSAQIASFEIMKFRSKRRRDRLCFSDEFVQEIAAEALQRADELEQRRNALQQCLQKLKPRDRELIQLRYAPGESGKHLASEIGRPPNSVYQSLGRIRRTLWECVQRRLAMETGT
jgi:RNA polymerase sigma-70 factor, ECF subfamily